MLVLQKQSTLESAFGNVLIEKKNSWNVLIPDRIICNVLIPDRISALESFGRGYEAIVSWQ